MQRLFQKSFSVVNRNGDEHGTAGNMSQAIPIVLAMLSLWLMCQS